MVLTGVDSAGGNTGAGIDGGKVAGTCWGTWGGTPETEDGTRDSGCAAAKEEPGIWFWTGVEEPLENAKGGGEAIVIFSSLDEV